MPTFGRSNGTTPSMASLAIQRTLAEIQREQSRTYTADDDQDTIPVTKVRLRAQSFAIERRLSAVDVGCVRWSQQRCNDNHTSIQAKFRPSDGTYMERD